MLTSKKHLLVLTELLADEEGSNQGGCAGGEFFYLLDFSGTVHILHPSDLGILSTISPTPSSSRSHLIVPFLYTDRAVSHDFQQEWGWVFHGDDPTSLILSLLLSVVEPEP